MTCWQQTEASECFLFFHIPFIPEREMSTPDSCWKGVSVFPVSPQSQENAVASIQWICGQFR